MEDNRLELYQQALEKWGAEPQITTAIEEMSELTKELCHYLRGNRKNNAESISEEIADVEIMLEQLKFTVFKNSFQVMMKKKSKLNRLGKTLEEEK